MNAAGSTNGTWLKIYVIAYILFLYLPIAIIPLFSFNNSIQAAFPSERLHARMVPEPPRQ